MTDHDQLQHQDGAQGFPIGLIITLILTVVLVIFIVENDHTVPVEFLPWSFDFPMYGIVFVSALFGAALTATVSAIRRRRRPR